MIYLVNFDLSIFTSVDSTLSKNSFQCPVIKKLHTLMNYSMIYLVNFDLSIFTSVGSTLSKK